MRAVAHDLAVFKNDDPVGIKHRADALGDDEACGVCQALSQSSLQERFGTHVDGTCTIIEDQDLRFLKKRSGNGQTLFLPAGEVDSALADQGIVSFRERADKRVSLGRRGTGDNLFVRSLTVAPSDVLAYGTGEQQGFLQYHTYAALATWPRTCHGHRHRRW